MRSQTDKYIKRNRYKSSILDRKRDRIKDSSIRRQRPRRKQKKTFRFVDFNKVYLGNKTIKLIEGGLRFGKRPSFCCRSAVQIRTSVRRSADRTRAAPTSPTSSSF